MTVIFSYILFIIVFGAVFSLLRVTHSERLSVNKTIIIGGMSFFFFILQLLSLFTGMLGVILACIGILHSKTAPKKERLFQFEFQLALAFFLTLIGYHLGYQVLFILLLPELIDLLMFIIKRFTHTGRSKAKLFYLNLTTPVQFKHFNILTGILAFLSAGVIGFSSNNTAVFVLALIVTMLSHESQQN